MARYSEPIDTTPEAIRKFADALRVMAADFDSQAQTMTDLKLDQVQVTHWKSARDGIAGYAAFAAALKKSIVAASQMHAVESLLTRKVEQSQVAVKAAQGALPSPQPQPKSKKSKS